jgi:hypothetical protein
MRKASSIDVERSIVRDDDDGVADLAQLGNAVVGLGAPPCSLEPERQRDDADRERAHLLGDPSNDRRGSGSCATTLARCDEHHVRASEHVLDLVVTLFSRPAPEVGVGSRAEALRELASDVELDRRLAHAQLLDVRVHGYELDLRDARLDHAVDGVQPAAADAHDPDDGQVGGRFRPWRPVKTRPRVGEPGDRRRLVVPLARRQTRLGRRARSRGWCSCERALGRLRRGVFDRGGLGGFLGGLPLALRLALGRLRRLEELRQRALTHAGAASRH